MGICTSKSNQPPILTNRAASERDKPLKLLLLGTGESGKSTLWKRILLQYGSGLTKEDRIDYAESILQLTIESMKTLVEESKLLVDKYNTNISQENQTAADLILKSPETLTTLSNELVESIESLWKDTGIKTTFKYRYKMQIPDSCTYFFNNVRSLTGDPYIPTETHVLRCRNRTTGIHKQRLRPLVEGEQSFEIIDVGGQRAERKKWINVFANVDVVMFVVGISEFDQTCFEDPETNRLIEAIEMFEKIVNSHFFKKTPSVLLFNKMDLFRDKISPEYENDFRFLDYEGPQHCEEKILEFISTKFIDRVHSQMPTKVRFICAIDESLDLTDVLNAAVEVTAKAAEKDD